MILADDLAHTHLSHPTHHQQDTSSLAANTKTWPRHVAFISQPLLGMIHAQIFNQSLYHFQQQCILLKTPPMPCLTRTFCDVCTLRHKIIVACLKLLAARTCAGAWLHKELLNENNKLSAERCPCQLRQKVQQKQPWAPSVIEGSWLKMCNSTQFWSVYAFGVCLQVIRTIGLSFGQ